jgi:DNA replication licensing factor MCM5
VNEAIRLFNVSTLEAATSGVAVSESLSPQLLNEVHNAETLLKRRLPIGSQISVKFIVDDFVRQVRD